MTRQPVLLIGAGVAALIAPIALRATERPVDAQSADTGAISVTVFDDLDKNGVNDEADTPVERVEIVITPTDESGGQQFEATTDANGVAVIPDVPPGEYRIEWFGIATVEVGWTTARSVEMTATAGETIDVAFGADFRQVTGVAFFDADEDLIRDAGELPAPGVLVSDFDGLVENTLTGDDGTFVVKRAGLGQSLVTDAPSGFAVMGGDYGFGRFAGPSELLDPLPFCGPSGTDLDPEADRCLANDVSGVEIPVLPVTYDLSLTAETAQLTVLVGDTIDVTFVGRRDKWVQPRAELEIVVPDGLSYVGIDEFNVFWTEPAALEPAGVLTTSCILPPCAPELIGPFVPLTVSFKAEQTGVATLSAQLIHRPVDNGFDEFFGPDIDLTDNMVTFEFMVIDRLPDTL